MRAGSIVNQLRWLGVAPALIMLAMLLIALTWQRFDDAESDLAGRGVFMSQFVAAAAEYGVMSGNPVELQQQARQLLQHPDVRRVHFFDANDALLYEAYSGVTAEPSMERYQRSFHASVYRQPMLDTGPLVGAFEGESVAPERIGSVELVLSAAPLIARQREILIATLMPAFIAMFFGLAIASRMAGRLSRPITRLSALVQGIRGGDFHVRGSDLLRGELAVLQDDINQLAAELERSREEQEQAMDALREARQRAESASLAKSEFLAMMSHELRTPMNGVMGMLQLLNGESLDEQQRQYAKAALESTANLLDVINDILDFSRVESGRIELEYLYFPLTDVVVSCVNNVRYMAEQKGLKLSVDGLDNIRAIEVCADPTRIRQIIANLLSNAVKFTASGEVRVTIKIDIMTSARASVVIAISDTGIGIPAEKLPSLFDAFSQVDSSTTRRYGGTGLGLAIAQRLTRLLGGVLTVESEEGRGTCFEARFVFACQKIEVNSPAVKDQQQPQISGHVLLVEDNEVNRLVAQHMLLAAGLTVDCAVDGEDALRQLARVTPDLVLMDIQMPVMDGLEAVRRYREHERSTGQQRLPFVALTANALIGERERCLQAGMDEYLAKPFQRREFITLLARYLSSPHS